MSEAPFRDVAAADELRPGEAKTVEVDGRVLLLCHTPEGHFAVGSRCSHAAWPLDGEALEGCELVCSLHGARFDVRDGSVNTGPTSKPLPSFETRVRAGRVEVRVPPLPI